MQSWESAISLLGLWTGRERSVQRPQPHNANLSKNRMEGENSRTQNGNEQLIGKWKSNGPAPQIHQSNTIEFRVNQIIQQGQWENKGHAVRRCSAAKRSTSKPMCWKSTGGNPHWHIRYNNSTMKRVHQVTPYLILHIHNTATDRECAISHKNTHPVNKQAQLTSWSSSLRSSAVLLSSTTLQKRIEIES